tara:strand:- start:4732 stop:5034 length:303 start_codon:yes stop_codon:yes gene_type:complete
MATYTFHNPSTSAYFTHELIRGSNGFYPTSSAQSQYFSGSIFSQITSSVIGNKEPIRGDFIFSTVVPPGTSSFVLTPGIDIPVSESIFRGTGEFTLILTT